MRLLAATLFAFILVGPADAADLMTFWDKPQHGGNSFNRLPPDEPYFKALAGYGATWVRLSYDKWKPAKRDYLIGDADEYAGIPAADLETLKATLNRADKAGLKVVIAPLSLPGMRWAQNNGNTFDGRLWRDKAWWDQAANFWRDLARELKDHPAVAAYNIVNEPAPEKNNGLAEHADPQAMRAWYASKKGSAADLRAFYETIITAIRAVDPTTPIMADAGWYGAADAFSYWPSGLMDQKVLYSFHMYEPYAATSAPNIKRDMPYAYPGKVPFGEGEETWDKARMAGYLAKPVQWAKDRSIPLSRLVAGEFGCMRRWSGCKTYLEDVLTALDKDDLHWAFYSFREDAWDGMDYELGSKAVGWKYWQQMEASGRDTTPRKSTPEFAPISRRLANDP
ncbi:cellulase family glycosylhydrolase (plasmid) [Sinorhizobium chiapasense]|uniref:glycoside hydrolase family 5 protein n=1 Tax=Sinorhizobium chiapasense TaxID=501572 RepID=UPI002FE2E0A5